MNPEYDEILALAEKIRPIIEHVAEKKGWTLTPQKEIADSIIEGLARNQLLHGKRYCPCRRLSGNLESDRQYICPCKMSDEDVIQNGHCHCYLYLKK